MAARTIVRFGVFELDLAADELRKRGMATSLRGQPLKILRLLISRPGEVVTRDELRQALWDESTFVEFDVGVNAAIRRLRRALGDSAEVPRFVETLPGRGYRFVAPIELRADPPVHPPATLPPDAAAV